MNFVEVDKIPKNGSTRKIEIKKLLDDFLKSNIRYAKVVLDEGEKLPAVFEFRYFTRDNAYSTLISVQERQNGIYLKRLTDQIDLINEEA